MKRSKRFSWLFGVVIGTMVLGFFVHRYINGPEVPLIRSEWDSRYYRADSVRRIDPRNADELDCAMHTAFRYNLGLGPTLFPLNARDNLELLTRLDHDWGRFGARAAYKPWAAKKAFRDSVLKAFRPSIWDINYCPWAYGRGPHQQEYFDEVYKTYAKWFNQRDWKVWLRFAGPLLISFVGYAAAMAVASMPLIIGLLLLLLLAVGGKHKVSPTAVGDAFKVVQVSHPSGDTVPQHGPVSVDAVVTDSTVGWLVVLAMFAVTVAIDGRRRIRTIIVRGSRAPPNWRCAMKSSFAMMAALLAVVICSGFVTMATASEVDLWFGEWNTGRGGALIYIYDAPNGKWSSIPSVPLTGSAFEELAQGHLVYGPLTITPAIAGGTLNKAEGTQLFLGGEFGASVAYRQFTLAGNYANRWSSQARFYDLVCVNLDALWSSRYSTRLGYQPVRYDTPEWDHRVMFRVSRMMKQFRLGTEFRMSMAHPHRVSGMVMISKDLGK